MVRIGPRRHTWGTVVLEQAGAHLCDDLVLGKELKDETVSIALCWAVTVRTSKDSTSPSRGLGLKRLGSAPVGMRKSYVYLRMR